MSPKCFYSAGWAWHSSAPSCFGFLLSVDSFVCRIYLQNTWFALPTNVYPPPPHETLFASKGSQTLCPTHQNFLIVTRTCWLWLEEDLVSTANSWYFVWLCLNWIRLKVRLNMYGTNGNIPLFCYFYYTIYPSVQVLLTFTIWGNAFQRLDFNSFVVYFWFRYLNKGV